MLGFNQLQYPLQPSGKASSKYRAAHKGKVRALNNDLDGIRWGADPATIKANAIKAALNSINKVNS